MTGHAKSRATKNANAKVAKRKHATRAKSLGQARREMKAAWKDSDKTPAGAKKGTQKAIKRHKKRVRKGVAYS